RNVNRRRVEERIRRGFVCQERLHFTPHRLVAAAHVGQNRVTVGRAVTEDDLMDPFHRFPTGVWDYHAKPPAEEGAVEDEKLSCLPHRRRMRPNSSRPGAAATHPRSTN